MTTARASVAISFLLQRSIGGDFGSARIHVMDIKGCVRADKSGTCRCARELMHVLTRHHGVTARTEGCTAAALHFHLRRTAHDHDVFGGCMPVPRDHATSSALENDH